MSVIDDIAAERRRQIEVEGWTPEHDDSHVYGELADASAVITLAAGGWRTELLDRFWPSNWTRIYLKSRPVRRALVIAAALLVAEIEQLDRKAAKAEGR